MHRYGAWAVGAMFALLPDMDFAIRALTGHQIPLDRPALHSLLAMTIVALLVTLVTDRRWGAVAGAGYASHLLADLLQQQPSTSVALLWPLHGRMEPILPLFPGIHLQRGDGVSGAAASLLWPTQFAALLQSTVIAAGIFFAVLLVTGRIRESRRRDARARGGGAGARRTPSPHLGRRE
jgi:hypothetical protein